MYDGKNIEIKSIMSKIRYITRYLLYKENKSDEEKLHSRLMKPNRSTNDLKELIGKKKVLISNENFSEDLELIKKYTKLIFNAVRGGDLRGIEIFERMSGGSSGIFRLYGNGQRPLC